MSWFSLFWGSALDTPSNQGDTRTNTHTTDTHTQSLSRYEELHSHVGRPKLQVESRIEMPYTYTSNNRDDYIFFWKITETHGWASQWYNSPFRARIDIRIEPKVKSRVSSSPSSSDTTSEPITIQSTDEHLFPTAEHWMMACKALLFNDQDIFAQVISTTGTSSSTLKTIKSLGRKVSNFDEEVWVAARYQIVVEGNLCKFRRVGIRG